MHKSGKDHHHDERRDMDNKRTLLINNVFFLFFKWKQEGETLEVVEEKKRKDGLSVVA